jgi:uncharacterized protein with HXXEE motif
MTLESITQWFFGLSFSQAVWLFPIATGLHFLEEARGFSEWAQLYALPTYDRRRWGRIHGAGMFFAIASSGLASSFPRQSIVWLFFALCFAESVWNAVFHVVATVWSREYCTGLATAVLLYPPLFLLVSESATRQGLLTVRQIAAAFCVAAVVHAVDVSSSVFGMSPLSVTRRLWT